MRVLVVDDSKAMRMIVTRSLRQIDLPDLILEEAATGMEALRIVNEHIPDLILADWNMPGMSGFELLVELKDQGYVGKFGFITTEASADMREQASAAGADCFVTKPFTPDTLSQALEGIL